MARKITKKGLIRKKDCEWKDIIRERDNYTCQICGKKINKYAHSHHIVPRQLKELRWDVNNGITLCFNHHKVGSYSPHQNALWFSEWMMINRPTQYCYLLDRLHGLNKTHSSVIDDKKVL